MLFNDDSWNQQIKAYNKSLSRDKGNDSIDFQYLITHIEEDLCINKATVEVKNEGKADAMVAVVCCKRPYRDDNDDYFFADIPDNDNICYYEFTRNNNNNNNDKHNNNNNCKKKKKTFVNIVCSILQLKYRVL